MKCSIPNCDAYVIDPLGPFPYCDNGHWNLDVLERMLTWDGETERKAKDISTPNDQAEIKARG